MSRVLDDLIRLFTGKPSPSRLAEYLAPRIIESSRLAADEFAEGGKLDLDGPTRDSVRDLYLAFSTHVVAHVVRVEFRREHQEFADALELAVASTLARAEPAIAEFRLLSLTSLIELADKELAHFPLDPRSLRGITAMTDAQAKAIVRRVHVTKDADELVLHAAFAAFSCIERILPEQAKRAFELGGNRIQ